MSDQESPEFAQLRKHRLKMDARAEANRQMADGINTDREAALMEEVERLKEEWGKTITINSEMLPELARLRQENEKLLEAGADYAADAESCSKECDRLRSLIAAKDAALDWISQAKVNKEWPVNIVRKAREARELS